jgi:hypothetical protein
MLSIKEKIKKVEKDYENQVAILDEQIVRAKNRYKSTNREDVDYLIDLKQLQARRESKFQALVDISNLKDYL